MPPILNPPEGGPGGLEAKGVNRAPEEAIEATWAEGVNKTLDETVEAIWAEGANTMAPPQAPLWMQLRPYYANNSRWGAVRATVPIRKMRSPYGLAKGRQMTLISYITQVT